MIWSKQIFSNWMSLFLMNDGASLALEDFFPDSLLKTKACRGRKGNFFEEQKALEIILGCFLDTCFVWAGEVTPEFCSEGARLTQCSKILLYRESTCCSRFATSSSSNSISAINSFVWHQAMTWRLLTYSKLAISWEIIRIAISTPSELRHHATAFCSLEDNWYGKECLGMSKKKKQYKKLKWPTHKLRTTNLLLTLVYKMAPIPCIKALPSQKQGP